MKQKYAIGITVNGNEVRAAFLNLVRGKACILALESAKLDTPLENADQTDGKGSLNDLERAFDIQEPQVDDEKETETSSETTISNNNVSIIYSLLDKFQQLKANIAINTPVLTVKYDTLESHAVPKKDKSLKRMVRGGMDLWGRDEDERRHTKYLDISDGKTLQVDYEYHPPIVDVIDEVNQFRAGKMNLVLMDTNELALVDLVKEIYKFEKNEITAIVYIEEDFARVIFLKGTNIYHITPIIHKGSMSKDVLEVIYSRMIFAQDQYFIPELNKVLVAGHSSKLKAKYYFRQKFPSAVTGYLNSKKIQSRLKFKDRGLLFSRYAIPIALAWKALQKHVVSSKTNFLPEYLLERQRMPKLAAHGYLLMFLLAITAFSFTWLLVAKNMEIRDVKRRTNRFKTQLENNKSLTERVSTFDNQIIDLEKKVALVDSFSQGYNETTEFLDLLNQAVRQTGSIWITELSKKNEMVHIRGMARRRDRIPTLANSLGGANLKKVTRAEYLDAKVFDFQLEKKIDTLGEETPSKNPDFFTFLKGENGTSEKTSKDKASSRNGVSPSGNTQSRKKVVPASTPSKVAAKPMSRSKNSRSEKPQSTAIDYRYGLQIGAFGSKTEAHKASEKYSDRGYPVMISRADGRGKNEYSVIVGAYEDKSQAQKLSKLFAARSKIENKVVRFKNTTTN